MSTTTCVSAVSGSLLAAGWPWQTRVRSSDESLAVSAVSGCLATSRLQIRLRRDHGAFVRRKRSMPPRGRLLVPGVSFTAPQRKALVKLPRFYPYERKPLLTISPAGGSPGGSAIATRRGAGLNDMPRTRPQCGGAAGIAMRRFAVIVTLGALLSMIAGAATAAPALAMQSLHAARSTAVKGTRARSR